MDNNRLYAAAPCCLTLLIQSDATCRDDANVKWTRLQSCSGIVLTNARLLLSPSNQTVQDFTKHAIPTYTHHAGIEKKKKTAPVKGSIFLVGLYESATSQLLTHQNQSGLSSGGGLWPGLPAPSLNNRRPFTSCLREHLHTLERHTPITWELIPASSNRGATSEWKIFCPFFFPPNGLINTKSLRGRSGPGQVRGVNVRVSILVNI